MPELPEVETTRSGLASHVIDAVVKKVIVRESRLRWPIPSSLAAKLKGLRIEGLSRRGKYLLFATVDGWLMVHLGMSGSLRLENKDNAPKKHDHVDICLDNGFIVRYCDPRRFGSMLWIDRGESTKPQHKLLDHLGPEPLSDEFDGDWLYDRSRKRKSAIKALIMDSKQVVGVGNIYANEALFYAGIRPTKAAGKVNRAAYQSLAQHIKQVLSRAIEQGGTTLQDFIGSDGQPGYFKQSLMVYGRGGEPCQVCDQELKEIKLGQRATVYCPHCQK